MCMYEHLCVIQLHKYMLCTLLSASFNARNNCLFDFGYCCLSAKKKFVYMSVATALMIKNLTTRVDTYALYLNWDRPQIVPAFYTTAGWCQVFGSAIKFVQPRTNIPGTQTTTRLQVRPGSYCDITLRAQYNPASIDAGLTRHILTPTTSKHTMK